jgi:hypothetical protein
MTPKQFLKLASPKIKYNEETLRVLRQAIANGDPIAPPFLQIETREVGRLAHVAGHEGRHRMKVLVDLDMGDTPVPIHMFGRGDMKARHWTPDQTDKLERLLSQEGGKVATIRPEDLIPDEIVDLKGATLIRDKQILTVGGEKRGIPRIVVKEGEGWVDLLDEADPEFIYRGISAEEMRDILRTKRVKSRGTYNIAPEEQGMTLFADNADSAASYAGGFAPTQFKPTPTHPGFVLKVRREGIDVRKVKPDSDYLMTPDIIPIDAIEEVWQVRPYAQQIMSGSLTAELAPVGTWTSGGGNFAGGRLVYRPVSPWSIDLQQGYSEAAVRVLLRDATPHGGEIFRASTLEEFFGNVLQETRDYFDRVEDAVVGLEAGTTRANAMLGVGLSQAHRKLNKIKSTLEITRTAGWTHSLGHESSVMQRIAREYGGDWLTDIRQELFDDASQRAGRLWEGDKGLGKVLYDLMEDANTGWRAGRPRWVTASPDAIDAVWDQYIEFRHALLELYDGHDPDTINWNLLNVRTSSLAGAEMRLDRWIAGKNDPENLYDTVQRAILLGELDADARAALTKTLREGTEDVLPDAVKQGLADVNDAIWKGFDEGRYTVPWLKQVRTMLDEMKGRAIVLPSAYSEEDGFYYMISNIEWFLKPDFDMPFDVTQKSPIKGLLEAIYDAEDIAGGIVDTWAGGSSGGSKQIAIQIAIAREFGLERPAMRHMAASTPYIGEFQRPARDVAQRLRDAAETARQAWQVALITETPGEPFWRKRFSAPVWNQLDDEYKAHLLDVGSRSVGEINEYLPKLEERIQQLTTQRQSAAVVVSQIEIEQERVRGLIKTGGLTKRQQTRLNNRTSELAEMYTEWAVRQTLLQRLYHDLVIERDGIQLVANMRPTPAHIVELHAEYRRTHSRLLEFSRQFAVASDVRQRLTEMIDRVEPQIPVLRAALFDVEADQIDGDEFWARIFGDRWKPRAFGDPAEPEHIHDQVFALLNKMDADETINGLTAETIELIYDHIEGPIRGTVIEVNMGFERRTMVQTAIRQKVVQVIGAHTGLKGAQYLKQQRKFWHDEVDRLQQRIEDLKVQLAPGSAIEVDDYNALALEHASLQVEQDVAMMISEQIDAHAAKWLRIHRGDPVEFEVPADLLAVDWAGYREALRQAVVNRQRIYDDALDFLQPGTGVEDVVRSVMRAMYERTQSELRSFGWDAVTLYRGFGLPTAAATNAFTPGGSFVGLSLQPSSSFSTSPFTTQFFARPVAGRRFGIHTVRVPRERILSLSTTGGGCLNEGECLILGGKPDLPGFFMPARVREVTQAGGRTVRREVPEFAGVEIGVADVLGGLRRHGLIGDDELIHFERIALEMVDEVDNSWNRNIGVSPLPWAARLPDESLERVPSARYTTNDLYDLVPQIFEQFPEAKLIRARQYTQLNDGSITLDTLREIGERWREVIGDWKIEDILTEADIHPVEGVEPTIAWMLDNLDQWDYDDIYETLTAAIATEWEEGIAAGIFRSLDWYGAGAPDGMI